MKPLFRDLAFIVGTAAIVGFSSFGLVSTAGLARDSVAAQIKRTADGKPDFSGIWQTTSTANWDLLTHDARPMVAQPGIYPDVPVLAAPVVALGTVGWVPPGIGVVEGDEIPYQEWAKKRKQENAANWLDRDPELKCYMPGVPRAMYLPYPFQIFQGTNKIMMIFEFANAQRAISLDKVDKYPGDAYMGYSVGHWEGDTLVVETTGFRDGLWLDIDGDPLTEQAKVTERFRRPNFGTLEIDVTIDDPKAYTHSFTVRVNQRIMVDTELIEFICEDRDATHYVGAK